MSEADVKRILSARNYYQILQVSKDVSDDDLKRAYKKLALLCHPDKNKSPGAEEAFKAVGKAFTTLSDPQKRSVYDRHGEEGLQKAQGRPQQYEHEDIYDLFAQMFGADGRGARTHTTYYYSQGQPPPHRHHPEKQQGPEWAINMVKLIPLLLFITLFFLFNAPYDEAPPFSLSYNQQGGYTRKRMTHDHRVPYYVSPSFTKEYSGDPAALYNVENLVFRTYKGQLAQKCKLEQREKYMMRNRASLYYSGKTQRDMLDKADSYPTKSCDEYNRVTKEFG
jgi:curved DNA-binding protein CbpA